MKLNPWAAAAVLTMLAFPLQAANEPEAGAIVRKDTEVTPKAEFSPGNMTDIMPSLSENKKEEEPEIYFSADEMETDEANAVITAVGNVIVPAEIWNWSATDCGMTRKKILSWRKAMRF